MKKFYIYLMTIALAFVMVACSKSQTSDQKIKDQTSKVYALNADERNLASSNAKSFFHMEFINANNSKGQFLNCNPSDSNFNGYVTCNGLVPQPNGTYKETVMYCGYNPELVGCSKTDTVK